MDFFDAIRILHLNREIAAGNKERHVWFLSRCTPIPITPPLKSLWKKEIVIEISYRYNELEFLSKFRYCYMFLLLIPSKCTLCYRKTHRFVPAN